MLATHKRTPSISYPIPLTDFPSPHTSPTQPSMSIRSQRGRRPSLPSPMSWLTRSSSTSSSTHPVRVSHAKSSSVGSIRHANIGTGVTIVRTPQEALAGSGVSIHSSSDQENEHGEVVARNRLVEEDEDEEGEEEEIRSEPADQTDSHHAEHTENHISVPPAYSPPRSSLPLSKSTPSLPLKDPHPGRLTRAQPHHPTASDTQKKLPPPPLSTLFPVPPLSAHLPSPSSPPPFDCILLSPAPPSAIDFSKLLVTLETCTATHRTTFGTLTSRPSLLATYLKSLFSDIDGELDPEAPPLSSPGENGSFHSIFHNHLASSGLLSPSAFNIHIFLDRASPSYDHILTYLRSPPTTADHVATLPHAVQLHAATPARLESLLALRDEAVYLDLPELAHLCTNELRRYPNIHAAQLSRTSSQHVVISHTRGQSSGGGSMRSMDTLREHDEDNAAATVAGAADAADIASTSSTGRDSFGSSKSTGSARGRDRARKAPTTPATAPAPVPAAKEKEGLSSHPTPAPLHHRRLASQSRERPELMDVKSATLRGRPSGNWL